MKKNRYPILAAAVAAVMALMLVMVHVDTSSSSVVPVLMYHSFGPSPEEGTHYASLSVEPGIFARQIEFFAKNRYNVIGPDKAVAYITRREKMPPKTVMLTADDGFMNFYDVAYPVLKKYNIHATIFVITDNIGRPGYLGWSQLREMADSGLITIGSHTKSHPWLPSVSVDGGRLRDELLGSKEILEKGMGKRVDYLCYPNGGFNGLVQEAAKEYGYKGAFTTNPSKHDGKLGDIYAIRRLKMSSSSDSPLKIWSKTNRFYAWFKERR